LHRENWRFWSTVVLAAIAALIALTAALEGWPALKALFDPT